MATPAAAHAKRLRIALIIDSESWAFAHIAHQIAGRLGDEFEFRIIPAAVIDNVAQVLMMTEDCAIVHFFWRDFLNSVTADSTRTYLDGLGYRSRGRFFERFIEGRHITTSIYDHLFLSQPEVRERLTLFNDLISGYTVSSRRLMAIYRRLSGIPDPVALTEDGVDLSLFRPINLQRFQSLGRRAMIIGWAGNSKWSSERGEDFKGLHTVLRPAVQELRDEGLDIRLELADRQQRQIPHAEMPEYYAQLDLYVCASRMEGTPNPVLEAAACGVPILSTDVGVVPEVFGSDPFGAILPERSVPALKRAIRRRYHASALRTRLSSSYNLRRIQRWGWDGKAEQFRTFFRHIAGLQDNVHEQERLSA